MKALVWNGRRDVRVEQVPDPDPGADVRDMSEFLTGVGARDQ